MFRPDDTGAQTDDEATVPADLAASWRSAETQLFGAVLDLPDLYRHVVAMVGDTVDRLRRLGPSTAALLNAAPHRRRTGQRQPRGSRAGRADRPGPRGSRRPRAAAP